MSLENNTLKELRQSCKDMNIKGYSKLNKEELINLLRDNTKKIVQYEKNRGIDNNIGIHVFKGANMAESIINAKKVLNINAVQIFTHGPRSTKKVNHDYGEIISATKEISTYIHSSYPTNPWNGKPNIFKHTIDQFKSSSELRAKGVVLHIPKINPKNVAIQTDILVKELYSKNLMRNQKVILEMKAVKKHETESYESPEKINRLIEELKKMNLTSEDVGICIDTAHIYSGEAKIKTYEEGVKYCNDILYPDWIYLIHLNGNVYDVNKRAGDKHAVPFDSEDKIWENILYSNSGCRAFIEYAKKIKIDIIVEIKEHHSFDDVKAFIDLMKV